MKRIVRVLGMAMAWVAVCGLVVSCSEKDNAQYDLSDTPEGPDVPVTPGDDETLAGYPRGLTVRSFTRELEGGAKCLGFYAIADFEANPSLRFRPQCSESKEPTRYFKEYSEEGAVPLVVVNGGYFAGKSSVSLLIEGGKMKSMPVQQEKYDKTPVYYPVRAALGQMGDGSFEAAWVYSVKDDGNKPYAFPSPLGNDYKEGLYMSEPPTSKTDGGRLWQPHNAIGAGPMLVYEGRNVAVVNYWKEILEPGGTSGMSRQPRTAIGATADGKLVVLVCDGRKMRGSAGFNLAELADKLIELGCVVAVNLDGGGSSTFVGGAGEVLNRPSDSGSGDQIKQRRIPTAVVIAEIK